MAGSLRWYKYTDDSGFPYSVNLDESNSNATCGGVALMVNRTTAHILPNSKLHKRYVLAFLTSNPAIRRRFWIGNPLAIPQILAQAAFLASVYPNSTDTPVPPSPWTVTAYRGEKAGLPPPFNILTGDTGLTEGSSARDAY
jgi:hypothetical protein